MKLTKITTKGGRTYRTTATVALVHHQGNTRPYFSITADREIKTRRGWHEDMSGCGDWIFDTFSKLRPYRNLHLADDDGAPMHAVENGFYQLAGCVRGGMGERYHSGNAERYGRPFAPLTALADHLRITEEEAARIAADVEAAFLAPLDSLAFGDSLIRRNDRAKHRFREHIDGMRDRWRAEAQAAIEALGLTVTHD